MRTKRKRFNRDDVEAEALERALANKSEANYPTILAGFKAKGIPDSDIRPRENVFTYHAWRKQGRQVLRGEHGVKIATMLDVEQRDQATGELTKVAVRRSTTVFHVTQTKPLGEAETEGEREHREQGGEQRSEDRRERQLDEQQGGDEFGAERRAKIAAKLRALAETRVDRLVHLMRPMSQRHTAKRFGQYMSRLNDAHRLRLVITALNRLADCWADNNLPPVLEKLQTVAAIDPLLSEEMQYHSNGYHPYHTPIHGAFRDQSLEGQSLQALVKHGAPPPSTKLDVLLAKLRGQKIDGFFPTPPELAQRAVEAADLQFGQEVLEPSAGIGSLAEAIKAKVETQLVCVERHADLCNVLKLKGFVVHQANFLEAHGEVDRIVMNPPFEKGQDIDHVRHAFKLLRPGGRLVAIMSAGAVQRSDTKATEFREWMRTGDRVCESIELIADAFKGLEAFRETGVTVALVVLEKMYSTGGHQ
jgi:predicted RNA methylase